MNKPLCLAAVSLISLAACAPIEPAANGAGAGTKASAAAGSYYCWKEKMLSEGDKLVCNWEDNATNACRSNVVRYIDKTTVVSGPANSRRCDNGEWLVMITTK